MQGLAHPTSRRQPRPFAVETERVAGELNDVLQRSGIYAALGYLNARTRFRFTGIYRTESPLLRNVHLFDRENPRLNLSGAVKRLEDSYCAIVQATSAPFATRDARRDPRLRTHAARDSVLCYLGVPIRLSSGCLWGTLCHFDVRPRLIPSGELALLEASSPTLARWLSAPAD